LVDVGGVFSAWRSPAHVTKDIAAALMLYMVGIVGVTMVLAVRLPSVVLAAPIALVVFVLMMVLKHGSGEHALGRVGLWLFSMALVLMVPAVVWIGPPSANGHLARCSTRCCGSINTTCAVNQRSTIDINIQRRCETIP
jgi:hypothetical protein